MGNSGLFNLYKQLSNKSINNRRFDAATDTKRGHDAHPRLMAVLAHPDDEALCIGGTLAKYAAQGVEISLLIATRGERGWRGTESENPGLRRMGEIRESELGQSARLLGVRSIAFLDYMDGEVDTAPQEELVTRIARAVRHFRPDVVITFDPHGMYGHPDHIAISQATTNALWSAADPGFDSASSSGAYRVPKLYYRVYSERSLEKYQSLFGELRMQIRGEARIASPWQEWAVTTRVDVRDRAELNLEAIACHQSQIRVTPSLRVRFLESSLGEFGNETYYRVFSILNRGRIPETDLFDGLRVTMPPRNEFIGRMHA